MIVGTTVGIELRGNDLRVAIVRRVFKSLRIINSASITGFLAMSIDERRQALLALAERLSLKARRVFLTLPRDTGTIRQIQLPGEVAGNLKAAVALQVETLSPWPEEEIYWDFAADPSPASGILNVTVAIVPRALVESWAEFFDSANLKLSGISLATTAWAHAALISQANRSLPVIIIGCETETVEGLLVHQGRLISASGHGSDVFAIARSVKDRLCKLARIDSAANPAVICHGGAAAGHVQLPEDWNIVPVASKEFFGAVSSAIQGGKAAQFRINLIPSNKRFRHNQLRVALAWASLAAVVLMGIALLARPFYQNLVYASEIEREIQRLTPAVKELTKEEADLAALTRERAELRALLGDRDVNLEVLAEIARLLPVTTTVTSYTYQNRTMTISGLSESATEIQKLLEDSPFLKDVQFPAAIVRATAGKDRFTIRASVEAQK